MTSRLRIFTELKHSRFIAGTDYVIARALINIPFIDASGIVIGLREIFIVGNRVATVSSTGKRESRSSCRRSVHIMQADSTQPSFRRNILRIVPIRRRERKHESVLFLSLSSRALNAQDMILLFAEYAKRG
ncbi:hypothetical protein PUN28_012569 [Cardiocondyla obscurior]|uniref:Uncharacterized protein n=1 Tax=Cardiocondyla obscurior TaxID=286306 RepID=A0AAW2FHV2_9HYME